MINQYKLPVTGIQRFTVRDGPGIRSTVFFKGCTLHCIWCHNPETVSPVMEICFYKNRCIECGRCAAVCPKGLFVQGHGAFVFNKQCNDCGLCADECPVSAITCAAQWMTVQEIVDAVLRDRLFYRHGGGVTLSGGEPLLQTELPHVLKLLREKGIHTAVDTALNIPWESIESVQSFTNLFLVDIKAMNSSLHKKLTGDDNRLILDNLSRLSKTHASIWIRIPVIPGFNDGELPAIASFVRNLGRDDIPVELIPFHNMAEEKYAALGKVMPLANVVQPGAESMEEYYLSIGDLPRVNYNR